MRMARVAIEALGEIPNCRFISASGETGDVSHLSCILGALHIEIGGCAAVS
jgi:hypothetical protein